MRENGLQMTLENGAGVLHILLGVGFGDGDALKRLIQQPHNSLLFIEGGNGDLRVFNFNLRIKTRLKNAYDSPKIIL